MKPASRQMDGRPAAPGFPPDPTTAEPQDDLPPGPEDNQETLSTRELDSATGPAARDSPPPAPEGTAAHPTKKVSRSRTRPDGHRAARGRTGSRYARACPGRGGPASRAPLGLLHLAPHPEDFLQAGAGPGRRAPPVPLRAPRAPSGGCRAASVRPLDARPDSRPCRRPDRDPSSPEPLFHCRPGCRCFPESLPPPGGPPDNQDGSD